MSRKKYIRRKKPDMKPCKEWPQDVCAAVQTALQHYHDKKFKYLRFGITSEPQEQYDWHRRRDGIHWTHMYICFSTQDSRLARLALQPLSQIDDYVSNELQYATTLFEPPKNYYIYILAGKRRKSHYQGISILELIKEQRMTIQERIGRAVVILRKRRGMSRRILSERACINLNYLGTIEQGKRNVSPVLLERISLALDMKVSDFFVQVEKVGT